MDRKGISFTLTIVVSMMVVLLTAVSVIMIQQNYLGDTEDRIQKGTQKRYEGIELSQLRSRCEVQKNSFCQIETSAPECPSGLSDSQKWACNLKVEGEWCYIFWEEEYNSIPECSDPKSEQEQEESKEESKEDGELPL